MCEKENWVVKSKKGCWGKPEINHVAATAGLGSKWEEVVFLETKPSKEGSAEPTQPGVLSAGARSVLPEGRNSAGAPAAEEDVAGWCWHP